MRRRADIDTEGDAFDEAQAGAKPAFLRPVIATAIDRTVAADRVSPARLAMTVLRPVANVELALPDWLMDSLSGAPLRMATIDERMRFVIGLARRNIAAGGGPFAAAVFSGDDGQLVAAGVNRVCGSRTSIAHAEMMAIAAAQQRLRSFDLGAPGLPRHELVCSCEPCLMCFGAVIWSGVAALACAARGEDAAAIGFDEGPKPADWVAELARRQIAVTRDIGRIEAVAVLQDYVAAGGAIYNPARR